MKVALVANQERPRALDISRRIIARCSDYGIQPFALESEHAERFGIPLCDADPDGDIDLIVAVGGDGTVLHGAQVGLAVDAPVFGINAGRLGFLADGEPADLDATMHALASGEWRVSARMTLEARIEGRPVAVGINDVVVEKMESQRLVNIDVWVDQHRFLAYRADGLIVATPTGSTAYSLSVGGPLLDPEGRAIVMTPVAPHSLFSRAMVFPPERVLRLEVLEDRPVGVTVDGIEVGSVEPGGVVEVGVGPEDARFVDLSGRWFGSVIKEKFHLE